MRDVLQSTARKFKIFMADSTNPLVGKTGLTTFTVYLSKDSGAEATVSPTLQERGHGFYEVTPTTAHRDTLGENAWVFTSSGAVDFPYKETVVATDNQLTNQPANVTQFGGTNGTFASGRPEVNTTHAAGTAWGSGAITAASIAAAALNGKGDWLTTLGANAPAGWINANAIVALALSGKGDWAVPGSAMALTSGERNSLAAVIEAFIVNEGDATAVMQAIADRIAADWVAGDASPLAVASAVRTNLAIELARIDATISSRGTGVALDAAGIRAAVGLSNPDLDTHLGNIEGTLNDGFAAVMTDIGQLLTRIPVALFAGVTSLGDWLRRLARKDAGTAGMIAAEAEIDTGGTSTFTGTTDNLEAIKDAGGGGGGGSGDATIENQEIIIDDIADLASQVSAAIASGIAVVQMSPVTIVGFPTSLNVGDSYTTDMNRSITVYMRDANNDPITGVGTHNFTDGDFSASLVITQSGQHARVVAQVDFVDPGGAAEAFLRVQIPASETRRANAGSATMQCVVRWTGVKLTIATQAVTWIPEI
jgi:hypothetical protein